MYFLDGYLHSFLLCVHLVMVLMDCVVILLMAAVHGSLYHYGPLRTPSD